MSRMLGTLPGASSIRRLPGLEGFKTMKRAIRIRATAVALGGLTLFLGLGTFERPAQGQAAEKVTVRFTWKYKGEYAPLFVALDKGYYKAEGLDVDLAEGSGAQTVLKLLASGGEKFGYGPAVSAAQAISQGLPVKVVALYQTRAPMGVIAFPDVPLKTPKDLEGKRLAISVGETFGDMLGPFTKLNNVDIDKIQKIQMEASVRNTQFLTRKIDVMSVYLSNELPQLEKRAKRQVQHAACLRVRSESARRLDYRRQRVRGAKSADRQEAAARHRQRLSRTPSPIRRTRQRSWRNT